MDEGFGGNAPSFLFLPRIYAAKGLPYGVDLTASYSMVPGGNAKLLGGAVKYAVVQGGPVTPAVSLRLSGSRLTGVSELDMTSYGVDLSVSKGFVLLTPYAGVGLTRIEADPDMDTIDLDDYSSTESKFFLGTQFSMGLWGIVAEAEFSEVNRYNLRFNVGL